MSKSETLRVGSSNNLKQIYQKTETRDSKRESLIDIECIFNGVNLLLHFQKNLCFL